MLADFHFSALVFLFFFFSIQFSPKIKMSPHGTHHICERCRESYCYYLMLFSWKKQLFISYILLFIHLHMKVFQIFINNFSIYQNHLPIFVYCICILGKFLNWFKLMLYNTAPSLYLTNRLCFHKSLLLISCSTIFSAILINSFLSKFLCNHYFPNTTHIFQYMLCLKKKLFLQLKSPVTVVSSTLWTRTISYRP